ncbi:hypothetical protein VKT23_000011 [Stygiomarasmius scandens]|uniref:Uncharacterized protein n=1 Tax=Marasmiellus scandens TaxID=2682957 RepID=A0ABR1K5H1_9AGAR
MVPWKVNTFETGGSTTDSLTEFCATLLQQQMQDVCHQREISYLVFRTVTRNLHNRSTHNTPGIAFAGIKSEEEDEELTRNSSSHPVYQQGSATLTDSYIYYKQR